MPERAPNAELLSALGRLVRGLSALFWGLPISLVVSVQTAKGDWLQPLGILPPLLAAGWLWYGVTLLRAFQRQERIWQTSLERARLLALVNLGLAPFLYWWNRVPSHPFYMAMVEVLILSGLFFLYCLNPMLWRLAAMLPDETLRLETRTFTLVNRYLLLVALGLLSFYFLAARLQPLLLERLWHGAIALLPFQNYATSATIWLDRGGLWILLFLILLPVAMTMALLWKIKDVLLASVFGPDQ